MKQCKKCHINVITDEKLCPLCQNKLIGKKEDKNKINKYVKNTTIVGLYTIKSIYKLLKNKKVKIPIINLIYDIIENKKEVEKLPEFLISKK